MSVCLALVVKDAADSIARCLESAKPLIDRWVIIDTGSSDDTKKIVEETLEGIPGRLLDREWRNFAENRSELLAEARLSEADYTLMLDADMELAIDAALPELTADEYYLMIYDRGLEYVLPLLTSNQHEFFYAGVAHACLNCKTPIGPIGRLPMIRVLDHGGGPGKDGKFERDLEALSAEILKHPNDHRSWFYLAQTYRDLGRHEEAIESYKHRAGMDDGSEEVYHSLYQAGLLLCEHVDYREGAALLMRAWEYRPSRAEALRALAGITGNVADKIPFPANDVLFVEPGAYSSRRTNVVKIGPPAATSFPDIEIPRRRRARVTKARGLDPRDVSAILVTRGNVDMQPILDSLPYDDIVIWDNSTKDVDYKVLGRYAAIPETKNPVIYWQDDDVIFTNHTELLKAYKPGRLVTNMDQNWIDGAGYGDFLGMQGAGSLCDANLPAEVFARYLEQHPFDDELLVEGDFAFGVLVPFTRVDLGYDVRPFSDDADRLYQQPGQTERKHAMIGRARAILAAEEAAAA